MKPIKKKAYDLHVVVHEEAANEYSFLRLIMYLFYAKR